MYLCKKILVNMYICTNTNQAFKQVWYPAGQVIKFETIEL